MKTIIKRSSQLFIIYFALFFTTISYPQEECKTWKQFNEVLKTCPPRPTFGTPELIINTSNFKIHYTLSGIDATSQTWVDSVAFYAEATWTKLNNLGWILPPADGGGGGDNNYDIYIRDTSSIGAYGFTSRECPNPHPVYPYSYTSWIEVSSKPVPVPLEPFSYLKSLVSHELTHASHIAYHGITPNWFGENTAVYMEKIIFPETNSLVDYRFGRYIFNPFKNPNLGITNEYLLYTGAVWPTFLHEYYGNSAVKKCWETIGKYANTSTNLLPEIDTTLKIYYSSDLEQAFKTYAVWRYFTGERAQIFTFFEHGLDYPTSKITATHNEYPCYGNEDTLPLKLAGGAGYIDFLSSIRRSINLNFDGENGFKWSAMAVIVKNNEPPLVSELSLGSDYSGTISLCSGENDYTVMIPVMKQYKPFYNAAKSYIYSAVVGNIACVKFMNKIRTTNAGGKLLLSPSDEVNSGDYRLLNLGQNYTVKTLHERFEADSIYKHKDWNGQSIKSKLFNSFIADVGENQSANFTGLNPVIIRNSLIDAPHQNFGAIQFKDPWYLHSDTTRPQPDSFFTYNVSQIPFSPTGAFNKTSGGVFLNQRHDVPNPVYYTVRVPQSQTIGGYNANFAYWTATGPGQTVVTNPTSLESPVIFKGANDTVIARYKGNLVSTLATVTGTNNQRKLLLTPDLNLHLVYESANNIWYTSSTNSGSNWEGEKLVNDYTSELNIFNRNVSIDKPFAEADGSYLITWENRKQLTNMDSVKIFCRFGNSAIEQIDSWADNNRFPANPVCGFPFVIFRVSGSYENNGWYYKCYSVMQRSWTTTRNLVPNIPNYVNKISVTSDLQNYTVHVTFDDRGVIKYFQGTIIDTSSRGNWYVDWSNLETISSGPNNINPNIISDINGNPHIAYTTVNTINPSTKSIVYVQLNNSGVIVNTRTWSNQGVEYDNSSITCNANGNIEIVFDDLTNNNIMIVYALLDSPPKVLQVNSRNPSAAKSYYGHRAILYTSGTNAPYHLKFKLDQEIVTQTASGWNMLSVPNIVHDFSKTAVWSNANSAASAYVQGVGYVEKNILENKIGYWVSFPSVQTKNYVGFPLDSVHIPVVNVSNGWNLIGSISQDLQTSKIYSVPANIIASRFWGYNNGYYISDFIKKGNGYWVKVNNNGKIILDVNSTASSSPPQCSEEPSVNPPGAPPQTILLSPSNGATGLSTTLTLSWNSSSGATSYSLQVSSDPCFTTFVLNDTNITTTSKYVGPLSYSTTYYWRVKPKNNVATGIWSNRWNFTIRSAPYIDPCAPINELSVMDQFSITDKNGNAQSLYAHNGGRKLALGLNDFDMPPLPPKGIFDARFKSGKFIEILVPDQSKKIKPIKIKDAQYPISFSWIVKDENKTTYWLITGKKEKISLLGSGNVNIDGLENGELSIEAQAVSPGPCIFYKADMGETPEEVKNIPTKYSLADNFPNPFNPVTQISYTLPEASHVTLKVYDVLGREVAVLVDGYKEAGYYEATWDATNVPSGVFFYKLSAGSFMSVKKMILIR